MRRTHCFELLLLFTIFVRAGFAQTNDCAPSDPGVRICSPGHDATLGSVATVIAGATAQSGNITAIRAYIDDNAVFTTFNPSSTNTFQAAQDVNVDAGAHHLVIVGYQDDGGAVVGDLNFVAITTTYAKCIPSQPGAMFCHPTDIGIQSPVQISAGASAQNGYITALRLYVDDVPQLTVLNPQQSQFFAMNEPLAIQFNPIDPLTIHTIVLVGYDSTGGAVTATQTAQTLSFLPPQVCPASDAPGVHVCSPTSTSCSLNGVFSIRATGTGASDSVDHMEIWADGNKLADSPGNSINTNIGRPLLGDFSILTLVEVDSHGNYIPSDPITLQIC